MARLTFNGQNYGQDSDNRVNVEVADEQADALLASGLFTQSTKGSAKAETDAGTKAADKAKK